MLNRSTTAASSVVGGLFPGPLTSPLSSSLSAIVADSLRRGTLDASYSSLGLPGGGGAAGAGGPGTLRRRGTTAAAAAGPRRPGTAQRGSSSLRVPGGSAGAVSTAAAAGSGSRKRHSITSGAGGVGSGGMSGVASERNPARREEVEGEAGTVNTRNAEHGHGSPPAGPARNRSLSATMGSLFGGSLRRQRSGEEG
ncbi:hypothetical protein KC343_g8853 [Hortaea werneckii]|nr:hypothetical protein KC352_g24416 [Hortaea werneckii]KAI7549626.1 hypothetical protein KC317_g14515 [Hortaea werneckii]KAI7609046.1 hypothetical protein KC346_g9352 [Hortaea werneckii]KAI7619083.1 hypothetical protein KC343_g8853 [Hortaea werneckii]KAI7639025.1 hypothetical protein KC319_g14591 [Hortaea werneckii]